MFTRLVPKDKAELLRLACSTFLEWHSKAIAAIKNPNFYVPPYGMYPQLNFNERTGMPWFSDISFSRVEKVPKKFSSLFPYGGELRSSLLVTASKVVNEKESNTFNSLCSWIVENAELSNYFAPATDDFTTLYLVKSTLGEYIANAIERCIYREGIKAATTREFERFFRPYFGSLLQKKIYFSLIVPVLGVRSPFRHFRINESTFLMKMSPTIQKSRSRIRDYSGNTNDGVVHLATHAFVSKRWAIPNENLIFSRFMLRQTIEVTISTIEAFFSALRIVCPIPTGYGQVLYYLHKAALDNYADLPPLHGTVIKRYPSDLSQLRYSSVPAPTVSRIDFEEVKELFKKISSNDHNSLQLALRRLNNCFVRDDEDDTLLDSTIGLELLLGDKGADAVSYKMRMRAAALSKVSGGRFTAREMKEKVKLVYDARSKLVHGKSSSRSPKLIALPTAQSKESLAGQDVLRSLARVLIENPKYLDVMKLDEELMLGF